MYCFGRSWRSLICLFDNFLHEVVHVNVRPVCALHDWLLCRQYDRDFQDDEPGDIDVQISKVTGVDLTVNGVRYPAGYKAQ